MRRFAPLLAAVALVLGVAAAPRHLVSHASAVPDFTHFESSHVHPASMTPDGTRLLVVNTPDNRLSVFDLTGPAPVRVAEIPVGMEPVSVACRSNGEAWVVNQLSDDVSIVDLTAGNVRATLRVGDEPTDVVFAAGRAWVCVSQEDAVKTWDPSNLAVAPIVVPVPGRTPRALAASADGQHVYAAVLDGGNHTTVLSATEAGDSLPPPNPPLDPSLPAPPKVGLIVKQLPNGNWVDETGKLWNSKIGYHQLDIDIADIATASRTVVRTIADVGAESFGIAVNALDGTVAATATEARNFTRFEPNVRGHLVDTRLALVTTAASTASIVNLNPHIDYAVTPGPQAERDSAVGLPTGVAWSGDGQRVYVTSLSSDRLAVLSGAGTLLARVPVVAGPTGVVVDDARGRIYVVGRFHQQVQTLSASTLASVALNPIGFDPTPDAIVNGRRFFYGGFTSGHGDQACASCHLFGDFDNLSWDLGNPQGTMQPINRAGQTDPLILASVHPMKGPMTTQSLRGLPNTGMFHWRADRNDLTAFNGAFISLMGRSAQLPDSEMAAFSDFVMPLAYPPNPNEFIDRTVPDAPAGVPSAKRGQTFFFNTVVDGPLRCNDCHTGTSSGPGTNGQIIDRNALQESQDFKVPQLRNLYRKTGFRDTVGVTNKRGFGFTHDGAVDNLFDFLHFPGFNFGTNQATADNTRRDVVAFLMCFDTGMPPAVGVQVTFDGTNNGNATLTGRVDTLRTQEEAGAIDVIAKGRVSGQPRGWLYLGAGQWKSDKSAQANIGTSALEALAATGTELTITGVPRGAGQRMGLDRDRDGYLDGDELDAGSDPGNPASTPANVGVANETLRPGLQAIGPNPFRTTTDVRFALGRAGRVDLAVYDVLGREVRSVARGLWLGAGVQHLAWDGRRADGGAAGAGVYFVRLKTPDGSWVRPAVRIQ